MSSKYKFNFGGATAKIIDDAKPKKFEADKRFWKPTTDDKGNATAIIRFLPTKDGTLFEKYFAHNFNYMVDGAKKYWIRNCTNTFDQEYIAEYGFDGNSCPVCVKNREYWNTGFDSDKKIASQRKRKLIYVCNILVVKNPAHPEDEGKVFLFNFGQKIFEKLKDKIDPSEEVKALGEGSYEQYMPFDQWEGADFKLVVVKQGEFPNYDKSEFGKQKPIGTDAKIDAIMDTTFDLNEFIAKDKFPTTEETISKLGKILGLKLTAADPSDTPEAEQPDEFDDIPDLTGNGAPASAPDNIIESETDSEVDPDEEFFKNLKP
jgi:hypothetical protein